MKAHVLRVQPIAHTEKNRREWWAFTDYPCHLTRIHRGSLGLALKMLEATAKTKFNTYTKYKGVVSPAKAVAIMKIIREAYNEFHSHQPE